MRRYRMISCSTDTILCVTTANFCQQSHANNHLLLLRDTFDFTPFLQKRLTPSRIALLRHC